jgi:hypothetical protein
MYEEQPLLKAAAPKSEFGRPILRGADGRGARLRSHAFTNRRRAGGSGILGAQISLQFLLALAVATKRPPRLNLFSPYLFARIAGVRDAWHTHTRFSIFYARVAPVHTRPIEIVQ